tara:strand:+ start:19435 stop:21033 length:1599 start_codon:yes stop_codon:yes gene_type:complete
MPVAMTERIRLLEESPPVQELNIGDSSLFSAIRYHMRSLISALYQPDSDAYLNEPALMLHFEMQKWLTSPLMPDTDVFLRCDLAADSAIRSKWGGEAARMIVTLKEMISSYAQEESVLNYELISTYAELAANPGEGRIKIWCHQKERDLYRELLRGVASLDDHEFICSLPEYRRSSPMDALVLYGPLRTHGVGQTPEAVISAPIYQRLIRFVWKGLADEVGFGSDPVVPTYDHLALMPVTTRMVTASERETGVPEYIEPADDLVLPGYIVPSKDSLSRCVRVEFPSEQCVLVRPGSRFLVYSPQGTDAEAIGYKHINEIEPGDYLLVHDADADLGELSIDATKAPLASVWKKALADSYRRHPGVCVQKMQQAGIDLKDLHRAAEKWTEWHGTTIHAPRRKRHFQALLTQVLELSLISSLEVHGKAISGWRRAWAEVESSRVTAIQHGVIGNAIVNEQLLVELHKELPVIRETVDLNDLHHFPLPRASGLKGSVIFKLVLGISRDFAAPTELIEKPIKLPVSEQYRSECGGDY